MTRVPWPYILTWLGLGLLVHVALSVSYWQLVAPRHKALRSDAVVAQAPTHVRVWITGDSHPRTAIDPRGLGPAVVNAAIGGQHMTKSYYRTRTLIERHDFDVDVMIVPLDPVTLTSWNSHQYAPEMVWGQYVDFVELAVVHSDPFRYLGYWLEAHVVPYMGELRSLNQIRTGRYGFGAGLPNGNYGAQPPRIRRQSAIESAEAHLAGGKLVDPTQAWALQQLVTWAEARGIRLVFIRFPAARAYALRLGEARHAIDETIVGSIVDPERHLLLDHESLFFGRDGLFSDPHHLNGRGRTLYTFGLKRVLTERGYLTDAVSDEPPPLR
ncbi:MAG: hypothetical protein AAGA48_35190 [Myxococcota bacterium]